MKTAPEKQPVLDDVPKSTHGREIALRIHAISVHWPFDMVAFWRTSDGQFVSACCSCGWKLENTPSEHNLILESVMHNNITNKRYSDVLQLYKKRDIDYQTAISFLVARGMTSDLAEEWLDKIMTDAI